MLRDSASKVIVSLFLIVTLTAYPFVSLAQSFDFSITVSPNSATILQGESASATVSVSLVSSPAETVTLSATAIPPTEEKVINGTAPPAGTALKHDPKVKYVDSVSDNTWNPGETVIYDNNSNNQYDAGDLKLAGTAPPTGTALKDDPKVKFVDSNNSDGWNSLETVVYDRDANGVYDVTAVPVTLTPNNGLPPFPSNMQVSTSGTTPPGTYIITIEGKAGTLTRSTTFKLTVEKNDYTISLSSTSGSVLPGGSTTTSVTVAGGLRETVDLSCPGLPVGITCTYNPSSGAPTFTSTLTLATANTLAPGAYTIIVRGISQTTNLIHETAYTLMVPTVQVNPTNTVGSSGQFTVKVSVRGFPSFSGYDIHLVYRHQSQGGPLDALTLTSICPEFDVSPGPPCVFPAGALVDTSILRVDSPTAGEVRILQTSTLGTDAPTQGDLFTVTFSTVGGSGSTLDLTLDAVFLGETAVPHVTKDGYYRCIQGDVDMNGQVNILDLARAGARFGKRSGDVGFDPEADLDGNDIINIIDLVLIGSNFGKSCT